ncbi:SsrA-binding protein SmpB [Symbiobacterium thermophilum]|uniref:SsrA-binding protein n=2 Tax=Symbiobacterium thermophilum TaxID=2734 RepID=SSRP_SYMTH|nr:SsrA-binding protein SmpB [Symbiobacterium thermophilum]Q67SL8.1 RecName: Full=SsrA-binding protein; AltName: Full=Small protein B [Symbiobacterium thermophilum IAM 14863]MBY6276644.1 SsrA-binding protein [Symbiobacterium thermophilum]BAD39325.1 tmRNA-binding protein [Symbiobacterium thermophilum IAM 14863]
MARAKAEIQPVAENRKARHDYFVEETYEAGIVLVGSEVKSCRAGRVNLRDAYAQIKDGEIFLLNCHISPFEQANRFNHEPLRPRKLLMHKSEIHRLYGKVREKGFTLVPLRLYFNQKGKVKVELALAKGKRAYDKRDDIAAREAKREMARALRGRYDD